MVLGQRLRHRFVFSLAGNAAFVAASEIEYRKKRLPFLAPPPMGLAAGLIPGVLGRAKLIIRFGIIRAVIARLAQVLRERPNLSGNCARQRMWCVPSVVWYMPVMIPDRHGAHTPAVVNAWVYRVPSLAS